MLTLPVHMLVDVTGGRLLAGSDAIMVSGVIIDSRQARAGCAFVAFPGVRVDGHAFLAEAVDAGARALVVTRDGADVREAVAHARHELAVVEVEDALRAVQDLAAYHRSRLRCPVVGVTGSTGKTTTKDLLYSALSTRLDVVATSANRNNELGVPLTLLDADARTEAIVLEMAMRAPGEITALCDIARPTHGLITNVGQSHIEVLGTQEAIADAKGELIEAVPGSGTAFLNGDDEWSSRLASKTSGKVVYYGVAKDADVRGTNIEVESNGCVSFTLESSVGSERVRLSLPGRHNAYNALAAAAVAIDLGLNLSDIAEGLACAAVTPMRMQVFTSADGVTVVNDAYNANPSSMRAALHTLVDMEARGRRIAVLGDMAELGSFTDLAHFKLGEEVAHLGLDGLVAIGGCARRIAEGAMAEGMDGAGVWMFTDVGEAVRFLGPSLRAGDIVLVKASRVMGLERVVEGIVGDQEEV